MAVGAVINNYEAAVAIEGQARSEKYEDRIILNQVNLIRELLNMIIYNRFKPNFVNAVMVLDTMLIIKGKDVVYDDAKEKIVEDLKIDMNEFRDLQLNKQLDYSICVFKEQLSLINRKMDRDVEGTLTIIESELVDQLKLGDDSQ